MRLDVTRVTTGQDVVNRVVRPETCIRSPAHDEPRRRRGPRRGRIVRYVGDSAGHRYGHPASQPTSPTRRRRRPRRPSPGTGSTTADTQQPAAPTTTTPAATSNDPPPAHDPATCLQSAAIQPAGAPQLRHAGRRREPAHRAGHARSRRRLPVAARPACLRHPSRRSAACVQTQPARQPARGAKVEGCFSTFPQSLTGAPQTKCLDPILQGALGGVQAPGEPDAESDAVAGRADQPSGTAHRPCRRCLQGTANTAGGTTTGHYHLVRRSHHPDHARAIRPRPSRSRPRRPSPADPRAAAPLPR